jgi:hypothetical protein
MQLFISKLFQTGWKPKYLSKQAMKLAAELLAYACMYATQNMS